MAVSLRRLLAAMLAVAAAVALRAAAESEPGWDVAAPDLLYAEGTAAYARGDWPGVVLNMERALRSRAALRALRLRCRTRCATELPWAPDLDLGPAPSLSQDPGAAALHDLRFFGAVLRRAACLRRCLGPPSAHLLSEELDLEFNKRSPYNYLQVAYFKINKLEKAVAAAHTFFVGNPEHMEMRQNLDYYLAVAAAVALRAAAESEPGWDVAAPDLLYGPCVPSACAAAHAVPRNCRGRRTSISINKLEKAVAPAHTFFVGNPEHMEMRQNLDCYQTMSGVKEEDFKDLEAKPHMLTGWASLTCSSLNCLYFITVSFSLPSAAWILVGDPGKRCDPERDSVSRLWNAQEYHHRSLLEKELLFFAYDIFGIPFVDPDSWTPEEVIPKRLQEKQKSERETAVRISQEIGNLMKEIETLVEEKTKESLDVSRLTREGGPLLYEGISLTMNSKVLNGSQRVVMDGVISDDECQELQRLTNAAATSGDGYRGQTSPHTPNEKFYGVTVLKALKLGQEGKVPLQSARMYYNVTEKVRRVMESYFRLDTPLYFSYSHLVCRTAIEESQAERKDSSHPVHVDNCILNAESLVCIKEPPAYTFRDYSAILYLNGDFDGGNFYFTELDAKTVTAEVQPQCGRAVGFSSGTENPHGVKAVTRGQRCAIALWFTLDPRHSERDRVQADDLVKMLFSPEEVDLPQEQPLPGQQDSPKPGEESLSDRESRHKDEL
ncbi:prolyl 3-hydroxylase 1 [Mastomys coucha]|uniref:prolyl 3-hydroxylase 1 n=1 Tax=Mastomys coucha TaxID=35658 RepID=UPI0012616E13|nr:prolyl 3-hydroxylase 1 [Mastomys coucha]